MNIHILIYGCIAFAPIHFIFSTILSKEIIAYEEGFLKRFFSLIVVWFVPVIGSIFVYRLLDLKWFEAPIEDIGGQTAIGGGMAELNAILDPKHRHVIEAKEKETIELNLDGQLYDRSNKKLTDKLKHDELYEKT